MFRAIVGILLIVTGIIAGLYVGIFVLFAAGIVSIIEGAKAFPVDSGMIAVGIVKCLLASPVGWIVGLILFWVGAAILSPDKAH